MHNNKTVKDSFSFLACRYTGRYAIYKSIFRYEQVCKRDYSHRDGNESKMTESEYNKMVTWCRDTIIFYDFIVWKLCTRFCFISLGALFLTIFRDFCLYENLAKPWWEHNTFNRTLYRYEMFMPWNGNFHLGPQATPDPSSLFDAYPGTVQMCTCCTMWYYRCTYLHDNMIKMANIKTRQESEESEKK